MNALAPPHLSRPNDPYADAPRDLSFEVVNGVRVEKRMSVWDQHLAGVLYAWLAPYCRQADIGRAEIETMFGMPGSSNDRKPDVAFVSYQRWAKSRAVPRVNAWPVVPDLTAEVVSPSDKMSDVVEKVHEYFDVGVRLVWLILPNIECVYVYTSRTTIQVLTRTDTLTGGEVVPGFQLPLHELFPEPSPEDEVSS